MIPNDQGYLRPFFTFFGGKWRLAPNYPKPKHDLIIEPFAGSAGYSTNYYYHDVILIEKDPAIASVWDFLIGASKDDIISIPDIDAETDIQGLNIPDGAKNLVGFWCARGSTQPRKRLTGWGKDKEKKYSRYYWGKEAKNRIISQIAYIKHWTIIHGSGIDFIQSHSNLKSCWFIDPPYQHSGGHHYTFSSVDLDYQRLSQSVQRLSGQVICCEGQDADYLNFRNLINGQGNNGRSFVEKVWTNDL